MTFFFFSFLNLLFINLSNCRENVNLGIPVVVLRCVRSEPSPAPEYSQDAYLPAGTPVISGRKPRSAPGVGSPSTLRQTSASSNWAVGHTAESTCLQAQTQRLTKHQCQPYAHIFLATLTMGWLNAS